MAHNPIGLTRLAAGHMAEHGVENARLEAELMLGHVLGMRRLDLYLQHDRPLGESEVEAFRAMVRRRLRREPLQYILGEAAFRTLTLKVDRRVLIPRPETEVLVGEVLGWAASRAGADGAEPLSALDVGTGSGAIAVSLAVEGPFERVVATDISPDALEVAAENARRHGAEVTIEFRRGSLWEAVPTGERFDAIVSNPPYIAEWERGELAPEVVDWEPAAALFAEEDGLSVLESLIRGAPDHLRPGGLLALEIGATQAAVVASRIGERGAYSAPRIVRDLAGRERVVMATLLPLASS